MEKGLTKIMILAFSFALGEEEPNPCNVRIAKEVERLLHEWTIRGNPVFIVAQWEVALQLEADCYEVDLVVSPGNENYLGSREVWEASKDILMEEDITNVVPVCQWLQMFKVRSLISKDGYNVLGEELGKVGFWNSPMNLQWWTKGPVRLCLYAALQGIFHYEGRFPENYRFPSAS